MQTDQLSKDGGATLALCDILLGAQSSRPTLRHLLTEFMLRWIEAISTWSQLAEAGAYASNLKHIRNRLFVECEIEGNGSYCSTCASAFTKLGFPYWQCG